MDIEASFSSITSDTRAIWSTKYILMACLYFSMALAVVEFAWPLLTTRPSESNSPSKIEVETEVSKITAAVEELASKPGLATDRALLLEVRNRLTKIEEKLVSESEKTIRGHAESTTRVADLILKFLAALSLLMALLTGLGLFSMKEIRDEANEARSKFEDLEVKINQVRKQIQARAGQLGLFDPLRTHEFSPKPIQIEFETYSNQILALDVYTDIPAEIHESLGMYFNVMIPYNPDKALLHFNKALEKSPNLAKALYGSGVALSRKAREMSGPEQREVLTRARNSFQKALDNDLSNPKCYFYMGWSYLEAREYEEAIRWFDDAAAKDPGQGLDYTWSIYNKVCAYSLLGKTTEALNLLGTIIHNSEVRKFARMDANGDLLNLRLHSGWKFEDLLGYQTYGIEGG